MPEVAVLLSKAIASELLAKWSWYCFMKRSCCEKGVLEILLL